ncbi:MAG: hypothetical protein JJU34_18100 [Lunatimonas sp.]|uniref:hypothetical protein n=1 Tax=Lunatimonas sp. TaxID=2060141 RepID=UPI00263B1E44|nr:hypothetical protein [Lunatimonas sp.]MCC5939198.1 hypothetical protein [Lunatimonas sp.]
MAIQDKVNQIKRLAKIREEIEKEISSELQKKSDLLKTVFQLKNQVQNMRSKVLRIKRDKQITHLLEVVRRCDYRISFLHRQLESNQLLCNHKLLQIPTVNEEIDRSATFNEAMSMYPFDWKVVLSSLN